MDLHKYDDQKNNEKKKENLAKGFFIFTLVLSFFKSVSRFTNSLFGDDISPGQY